MTFALWTILAAAFLPLVTTGIAKAGRSGYDNAAPRAWEAGLSGWRARASAAHRNHYEAFGPFAAAVLVAHVAGGPQGTVDGLAAAFIVARLGYTWAYIQDRPGLRSSLWGAGLLCDVLLFCSPLLSRLGQR